MSITPDMLRKLAAEPAQQDIGRNIRGDVRLALRQAADEIERLHSNLQAALDGK